MSNTSYETPNPFPMNGCFEFMLVVMFIFSWLVEVFFQTLCIHMAIAFIIGFVFLCMVVVGHEMTCKLHKKCIGNNTKKLQYTMKPK
jgi:hypothetical protein